MKILPWRFHIHWRKRGTSLGGIWGGRFTYFDAMNKMDELRAKYPDRDFWMGPSKSLAHLKSRKQRGEKIIK